MVFGCCERKGFRLKVILFSSLELISLVIANQTKTSMHSTECDQKGLVLPNFSLTLASFPRKTPEAIKVVRTIPVNCEKEHQTRRTLAYLPARLLIFFVKLNQLKVAPITLSDCGGTAEGPLIKFPTWTERKGKLAAQPI